MKKLRLALLAGGKSGERDVSLKGAEEVARALDPKKYEVKRYDPATDIAKLAADADSLDVAFILLHGPFGEDGTVQGLLDLLSIPYQGSGVLGSAVAMDKNLAKILYRNAGLKVPEWYMAEKEDINNPSKILGHLGLPLVIKPASQGSSLGMTVARSEEDIVAGLKKAFAIDRAVMVEEFIAGREITVGVIGNDELSALPLVEIIPGDEYEFFDYEAKYQPGATKEICPADLEEPLAIRAQNYALSAHRALQLRGYSRTDMIISNDDIFVLETNTIPGMTPTSLLPQAAAAAGLDFSALLDRLIELARE
ncbi:MAG: D-alanine--D-alanine ligase [Desulfobacterales bacterium SG8_35_2]|nr:MAG: D-alanine--D-alanine ligase [Desulfobacterales bacterium SG8_35_2]